VDTVLLLVFMALANLNQAFYMTTFSDQMIELLPHDQVPNWPLHDIKKMPFQKAGRADSKTKKNPGPFWALSCGHL